MSTPIDRLYYQTTRGVRTAWFSAHYAAAMRLAPKLDEPLDGPLPSWRAIYSDLRGLLERDWQNVRDGLYPAPEAAGIDLARSARRSLAFFRDLGDVNRRRVNGIADEINATPLQGRYPRYYLQNFHYQSGGYLTEGSAELYDHQVEVLFVGGADAMRRQALAGLSRFLRGPGGRNARHLDIACGTGRFLTILKQARPRQRVVGLDLSPPYLREAERTLRAWSRTSLLQANAEQIPFSDESFKTLSCIFLFHELPRKVRIRVAREMARLLKPGGRLFFLDSIQLGDYPAFDTLLSRFPKAFHEPYYDDFIRADLAAIFQAAGLRVVESERAFFSKLLILEKPGALEM